MFFWIVGLLVVFKKICLAISAYVLILVFLDSGSSGIFKIGGTVSSNLVLILVFLDSGSSGKISFAITCGLSES